MIRNQTIFFTKNAPLNLGTGLSMDGKRGEAQKRAKKQQRKKQSDTIIAACEAGTTHMGRKSETPPALISYHTGQCISRQITAMNH
ncbi:MAG: hypothetical protein KDD92_09725 [Caldilineaceae bacterium]|nr:hypothetical protein [Caldilineaceae bacterium]